MFFSSIMDVNDSVKEINRLISKGMLNVYYWEKLTLLKVRFS